MSTSSRIVYKNPPLQIQKRQFYKKDSKEFKSMFQLLHEELSNDKECVVKYCGDCHIILTRAGHKLTPSNL